MEVKELSFEKLSFENSNKTNIKTHSLYAIIGEYNYKYT